MSPEEKSHVASGNASTAVAAPNAYATAAAGPPSSRKGKSRSSIERPSPLLREGELLGGRYQVERCLGSGGMASVYRAMHTGLDQPVAIKVVSPLLRELPGVVQRFMREARAATRLKGEHVVRVFDVGTTNEGAPYLVMELLEGKDLSELLDEGIKPTLEDAIDYALQACEALAEVHGLGIVHRDLKPANLFITRGPDGLACLKLIDFGISRVDSPLSPKDATSLTNPDVVMGSPRYMPPEQMESAAAADSRSDIWGLGAILYEMLCGSSPFDGESLWDIYAAAVRSPPKKPSALRDDLPTDFDAVLLKCLMVDPSDRYADVAELALALAPFGNDQAATRVDAIARVLEATRTRGHEGASVDGALAHNGKDGSKSASSGSSRIRHRWSSASRATKRRRRLVGVVAAIMALAIGVVVAARPLTQHMDLTPSVSVNGAAAATAATPAEAPAALATTMVNAAVIDSLSTAAAAADASAPMTPSPTSHAVVAVQHWAPRPSAPPATVSAPASETTAATPSPSPVLANDLPAEPATSPSSPSPSASPPPRDDRTLFEDRK